MMKRDEVTKRDEFYYQTSSWFLGAVMVPDNSNLGAEMAPGNINAVTRCCDGTQ